MSEDRIESLTRSLTAVASTQLPAHMKTALQEGIAELIQRELPAKVETKPEAKIQPQSGIADKKVYLHFHGERASGKSRMAKVVSDALRAQGFKVTVDVAGNDTDVVTVENPLHREDVVAGCKVSEMDAGLRTYAELLGKKLNVDPRSIMFIQTSL